MKKDSYRRPAYQCRYCGRSIFYDDDYAKDPYGEYTCAWCLEDMEKETEEDVTDDE